MAALGPSGGALGLRILWAVLLMALLALNGAIAWGLTTADLRLRILPEPPSLLALQAQGLGDAQASFRARALQVQHAGNLDGRLVPYRVYDYRRLERWLRRLDELDARPHISPFIAAFLFSSTQDGAQTRHLVDYLADHARADPPGKWRYMAHAVWLAQHRMGDLARARALAAELRGWPQPEILPWARQLEVFLLREQGEVDAAIAILSALACDPGLHPVERDWMVWYAQRHFGRRLSPLPGCQVEAE